LTAPLAEGDLLVLVSHDCDICHGSLEEEPCVEVIVARHLPSTEENGNYLYGKNPRRLQFQTVIDRERRLYEMRATERVSFPRRLLAERGAPGRSVIEVRLLQSWLARRYSRTALPSAFNERCLPAQKHLTEALKTTHEAITGVYLQMSAREELEEDQNYRVFVYLTATAATLDQEDQYSIAIRARAAVQNAFARCTGIELLGVELLSEAELTLEDLGRLVRWDYSDYLSQREGTPDAAARQP
jgi:hypothetical protein